MKLHKFNVEVRSDKGLVELSTDIARQLCLQRGKAVIVCNNPAILLSLVKKRWLHLSRRLQTQRASTLDVQKILTLTKEVSWMHSRHFSAKATPEVLEFFEVDVLFATIEELLRFAPECQVLFVACPITKEQLYVITAWMPKGGRIVIYNN